MNKMIKNMSMVVVTALTMSTVAMAEGTVPSSAVVSDTVKLIDIAGKQRMLSQRIAKDIFMQVKK